MFIALIYPREGLATARLFVDMVSNYVTVNNKGGATCSNTKQLLQASSLVINIASIAMDPVPRALERNLARGLNYSFSHASNISTLYMHKNKTTTTTTTTINVSEHMHLRAPRSSIFWEACPRHP